MDYKKEYVPLFPTDYDYLNESYQKLQQQLTAIDYELDNKLKDKGPILDFTPLGAEGNYHPDMRENREKYLERSRSKSVSGYKKTISKHIGGMDEKQQKNIFDRFDFETSRNGFKNYSNDNLKSVKDVNKQDKVSFDFMAASHFNKYQERDKFFAGEKENIDVWSDNYTKMLDDYRNRQDVQIVHDIDGPDLGKE